MGLIAPRFLRGQAMEILKVAGKSHPGKVAGAIAGITRDGKQAQVRAIGAAAVNQAIKAVIIARSYLATDGIDVICVPGFVNVDIDGLERTALTLVVEPRRANLAAAASASAPPEVAASSQ
jgi:stage V sporulation protein S